MTLTDRVVRETLGIVAENTPSVGQIWRGTKRCETWLVVRIASFYAGHTRARCEMMVSEDGRWIRRVGDDGEYCNTTVKTTRFGRDFVRVPPGPWVSPAWGGPS